MSSRLVYGVGVVDVDYTVSTRTMIDNKVITKYCPYYQKWKDILRRCYSTDFLNKNTTYRGCTVDSDWFYLSNFTRWVDSQPNKDWVNCHIDKDILFQDNKHYSEHTCVFVSAEVNTFILKRQNRRGHHPVGVRWHKKDKKFRAECSDPFKQNVRYLGNFDTELEAHLAWKAKKHEYACILASIQQDERVAKVLRNMYSPDTNWLSK